MILSNLFYGIGGLISFYLLWSLIKLLYRNIVLPIFFSRRNEIRKFGSWVVITGATDGIGKAFAELLARDGYNLVLISRSDEKLNIVKKHLLATRDVQIKVIKSDFTEVNIYDTIMKNLEGLDIGMLINNVGISYSFPNYLTNDDITDKLASDIINCNCLSMVIMTKLVLKAGMLKRGGFILNISSTMSLLPAPLLAIYAASKSFVNSFSLSMQSELKNSRVFLQNVEPLVVSTNMSKTKATILAPSAKSYANSVLNRLGTCSRTHGCFVHEIQGWFVSNIPEYIAEIMVHSSMINIRERALKKMMKKQ